MKSIFSMHTADAQRILAEIAEPMANVFADPAVDEALKKVFERAGKNVSGLRVTVLASSIIAPVMLNEEHREDVYKIIAACKGIEVEKVKRQSFITTVSDIMGLLTVDDDAARFQDDAEGGRA